MSNKEGMAKNWQVCKDEWADYRQQVSVVLDRVHRTDGVGRKLHHLSGLGPDLHRFMPRSLWYGSVVLGLAGWLVCGFVVWQVWG